MAKITTTTTTTTHEFKRRELLSLATLELTAGESFFVSKLAEIESIQLKDRKGEDKHYKNGDPVVRSSIRVCNLKTGQTMKMECPLSVGRILGPAAIGDKFEIVVTPGAEKRDRSTYSIYSIE